MFLFFYKWMVYAFVLCNYLLAWFLISYIDDVDKLLIKIIDLKQMVSCKSFFAIFNNLGVTGIGWRLERYLICSSISLNIYFGLSDLRRYFIYIDKKTQIFWISREVISRWIIVTWIFKNEILHNFFDSFNHKNRIWWFNLLHNKW